MMMMKRPTYITLGLLVVVEVLRWVTCRSGVGGLAAGIKACRCGSAAGVGWTSSWARVRRRRRRRVVRIVPIRS